MKKGSLQRILRVGGHIYVLSNAVSELVLLVKAQLVIAEASLASLEDLAAALPHGVSQHESSLIWLHVLVIHFLYYYKVFINLSLFQV